ncbi:MAG TPA: T9SS type A sorting domain-containing protein [Bacteroidales bacterium]|nr:T9SS type A sorting domain-containing protein [Bacteroidales bacterium]
MPRTCLVVEPPAMPVICMVTFDTLLNRNLVIWNKHAGDQLAHYNVYRETYQNNVFSKVGEVPWSSLSEYSDPSADPLVKSDRYRLSVTDSAGNESEKSPVHKTIHLNINAGIYGFNLIWNPYEGFEFLTYRIHRKHQGEAWQTIDSVASNITSYTDFYTTTGITTYYIEVLRPEPCHPTLKSTDISSVISNTAAAAPMGVTDDPLTGVMFYPNPVRDKLNVAMPGKPDFRVDIIRLDGITLRSTRCDGPHAVIDVADLTRGIYILKISADNALTVRKMVKD